MKTVLAKTAKKATTKSVVQKWRKKIDVQKNIRIDVPKCCPKMMSKSDVHKSCPKMMFKSDV